MLKHTFKKHFLYPNNFYCQLLENCIKKQIYRATVWRGTASALSLPTYESDDHFGNN